jgi:hypothetical protein
MEWGTIAKAALVGLDGYSKYNQYSSGKKARDAELKAIQAQMQQAAAEDAAESQYASQVAAYNARARAASAAASAATDANRKTASNKANQQYVKDQKVLKKTYDPYVQMFGRVVPQMEESYSTGLGSLADLLTTAKAERKRRPTDVAAINFGVK